MRAKLLLRFDDLCPTMNWAAWSQIEQALLDTGVKPLLAVIPNNRDPEFQVTAPRKDFWDQVRLWNSRAWTIGVHGYQHGYVTRSAGLLGIHPASEFAGLPFDEQARKINLALGIFFNEGLQPNVWVAPGHSFDANTLRVLPKVGLDVVSDGMGLLPYQDASGILWIPQQMWRFRPMPLGVWTVCLHFNSWGAGAVDRFRHQLLKYRNRITSFDEVIAQYRGRTRKPWDSASELTMRTLLRLKRPIRNLMPAVNPAEPAGA
jgi:predicted deacetylase